MNHVFSLQGLHLSNNGYSSVTLDPTFTHTSLQRLHINNNEISEWVELERLGHAFPTLQTLVAIANQLNKITNVTSPSVFPSLNCLTLNSTLNSTNLSKWSSVDALTALPDLRDLSLLGVPLDQRMREKERRFARMPSLLVLNKSVISATERENAERWAIRHYHDKKDKLSTYQRLVEVHGPPLQPLADLSLAPLHHEATIQFHIDHEDWKRMEVHTVDLHQTTGSAEMLAGWPGSTMSLSPS